MVAIKIQSASDIVKAYLKGLNYDEKAAEKATKNILENLGKKFKPDDDVTKILDDFLLKKAKKVIKNKNLNNEQILAYFKTRFIMENGAEKYDFKDEMKDSFLEELAQKGLEVIPEYHLSQMLPQKIESTSAKSILKNLFKKNKKK